MATAGSIAALIQERRTISLFKPELPPREIVMQGLELARWAPNHRLTEPWRFYMLGPCTVTAVIRLNADIVAAKKGESAAQAKLRQWSTIPGWLLVTVMRSADDLREREDYAACACAIQNLAIFFWSQGIGMKWTTGDVTRDGRFFELLGIDPASQKVVGLLWYGYPQEIPKGRRSGLATSLIELP